MEKRKKKLDYYFLHQYIQNTFTRVWEYQTKDRTNGRTSISLVFPLLADEIALGMGEMV